MSVIKKQKGLLAKKESRACNQNSIFEEIFFCWPTFEIGTLLAGWGCIISTTGLAIILSFALAEP